MNFWILINFFLFISQPIYGSDRIGEKVENVVLAASATADGLKMPGDGITSISEYQNWITSTNKTSLLPGGTDQLCECKVKSLSGTNYGTIGTAAEFLGVAENGVAVAENLQGELQFYVVLAKKYLGNGDACLIYDKDGKLMKGTELIGGIDVNSKPIITNITGTNKYAITHLDNNKLPVYHVVDMDQTGYGTISAAGEVVSVNQPMTNYSSNAPQHGWHFTAYEDHIANRSIVYNTRYKANPVMPIKGTTEIVAYEFGTDITQTPTEHVLYSIEGCGNTETGQLQLSPNGEKLLWYQHDKNVGGFSHRLADIYTFELNTNKTSVSENIHIVHSSQAGNYGKGIAEVMANNEDILYSQRGVYKEGSQATKYERNVWKYVKATASLSHINALDPTTTYLFSEIKRGVDGNYYMPNMGTPADKIHSYSGSAFNTNVNLGEAGNELASSLPTQVYKVFADPAQIPSDNLRAIGKKQFELKDHQNSQRVSISDEKLVVDVNANNVIDNGDIFTPSVKSYSDFFPMGGMPMPTRTYNANASTFGYQGQLKVNEIYGVGNVNEFKYRDSDARKGGDFWSPDPLSEKYPQCSPYQFSERRTIDGVELEGLEWNSTNDRTGFIQSSSQYQTESDPFKAFVIDVSAIALNWFTPFGVIDEAIVVWANSNSTTPEKVQATFDAAMGTPISVGHPEAPHVNESKLEVPKSELKPLDSRVKLRKSTKEDIKKVGPKTKNNQFIDPNTKKPIESGQEVYGHKKGKEWSNYKKDPVNQNKTRKDVIEDQNDPNIYQIEDKKSNASHKYEAPKPQQ